MGNDCKQINQLTISAEYPFIQPMQHPAFGHILHLKSDKNRSQKALKRIACPSQQTLDTIKTRTQFATQCENSISTLIQIYEYEIVQNQSEEAALWSKLQNKPLKCGKTQTSFIVIHFEYYPSECCLTQIMKNRIQALQKLRRKFGNEMVASANEIRLCDYRQIDKLQSQLRQVVNQYYQEIEIVRMIDHLVGALYFLHHFNVPHGAVRIDSLLVDTEGKFILIDREIFQLKTNYQQALQFLKKIERMELSIPLKGQKIGIEFLAPQCLIDLKQRSQCQTTNLEKIDIYCVGLLALRMCIVQTDQPLFEYYSQKNNFRFNEQQLNLRLLVVEKRYSKKLYELLTKMLKKDPKQRHEFSQLIDHLNPILLSNLQSIKKIHTPKETLKVQSQSVEMENQEKNVLKQKLISIQKQFQRIMNNRTMLFNRNINQKQIRDEEEKILKKLQKIKYIKSVFQSTEPQTSKRNPHQKFTPQIKNFSVSRATSQFQSPKTMKTKHENNRYLSGKELEAIVRNQYENIKSKRS